MSVIPCGVSADRKLFDATKTFISTMTRYTILVDFPAQIYCWGLGFLSEQLGEYCWMFIVFVVLVECQLHFPYLWINSHHSGSPWNTTICLTMGQSYDSLGKNGMAHHQSYNCLTIPRVTWLQFRLLATGLHLQGLQHPAVLYTGFATFPAIFQGAKSVGKLDSLNDCVNHLMTTVKMVVQSCSGMW